MLPHPCNFNPLCSCTHHNSKVGYTLFPLHIPFQDFHLILYCALFFLTFTGLYSKLTCSLSYDIFALCSNQSIKVLFPGPSSLQLHPTSQGYQLSGSSFLSHPRQNIYNTFPSTQSYSTVCKHNMY